jgi:2-polyprenyl-6-methoxyphenol hydroxylase-like FAD-dependent oxidoreductase
MAGLGAARALANHFERVTIVERDELSTDAQSRKGVPQGAHAHGLLPSGYRILDDYFPGMTNEIVDAGGTRGDITGDFLWHHYGRWKLRADCGLVSLMVSRPFLERKVRERVRALPEVTLLDGHDIEELVFDAATNRVTGARVKQRATGETRQLDADLVVEALGRGSPSPKWLQAWGFEAPGETTVRVDVGYSSASFDRLPADLHGSAGGLIVVGSAPQSKRIGGAVAAEGNRWVVTLGGCLGDHPPTDLPAWREFAASLATDDVANLVRDREPHGPIATYRFTSNRHRHYERLRRFPAGFLIIGDAYCSFNPIYGQGMSVALIEARALDDVLGAGDDDLAARFFAKANAVVANPWAITTGEDYRYPEVEGTRPRGFGLICRYMQRAHRAAARDPVILRRFFEVASLLAPPTAMMSPGIAWRVLVGGVGAWQETPAKKVARSPGS